jgi:pseudouridylate synthase / pseudouridine kinase
VRSHIAPQPTVNETRPDSIPSERLSKEVDILVAGSLASDTMCDYRPFQISGGSTSPALHTSNPANISQSPGGVGRNVAVAAHLAGASVALASVVADDLAGSSLLGHIAESGLPTEAILRLLARDGARTAQYVAVNDTAKDLVLGMADMSIFTRPELEVPEYWMAKMEEYKPKWVVVDANWSASILSSIFAAAKAHGALIAFEPVSVAKATRLFDKRTSFISGASVVPNHVVSLATPNNYELTAIYNAASDAMMFESEQWWSIIDAFGFSGAGSQDRLVSVAGRDLVEQGIPQQCVQLLPFIPNLVTKLGRKGCLLASLLRHGDERLTRPENAPYVLSRNLSSDGEIGGLYMRLIPPFTEVKEEDVASVNGVGDTMLGCIVAGLVKGRTLEEVLPIAQEAAVLTLKSPEAVSSQVRDLRARLR